MSVDHLLAVVDLTPLRWLMIYLGCAALFLWIAELAARAVINAMHARSVQQVKASAGAQDVAAAAHEVSADSELAKKVSQYDEVGARLPKREKSDDFARDSKKLKPAHADYD